jgi:hypothetical protein
MRQQFVNAACRLGRQTLKNVLEVGAGVVPVDARRVAYFSPRAYRACCSAIARLHNHHKAPDQRLKFASCEPFKRSWNLNALIIACLTLSLALG